MPISRSSLVCLLVLGACSPASDQKSDAGSAPPAITPGTGGGPAMAIGSAGSGGSAASGTVASGAGGMAASGTGGSSTAPADAGHRDSGSSSTPQSDAAADAGRLDAGASNDPATYAGGLDALFIDAPCDPATPMPLAQQATCQHPPNTQHIEMPVTFGGDAQVEYAVKLRVRGIWEPTSITGGQRPYQDTPFTVGGMVASGVDPINYQQYFIKVSKPAQTYWLNDYQYVAHDIHKADYEATLQIAGAAEVTVVMNDGNDHEIANWTKDYFDGLPPYDTAPSLGQMLRLDVISVSAP
jgi:hypothetical protein